MPLVAEPIDRNKDFFGKYTPTKWDQDTNKVVENKQFMFNHDREHVDSINPRVHYNLFDEKEKSTILLGGMLKMKKNMFLTSKTEFDESALLRLEEMEDKFLENKKPETEGDLANEMLLGKRYFEHKEKSSSSTGEKFRLITQDELAKKRTKEICLNCLSENHSEQSCPQKTCFKCGQEGHLVGACPHKNDKITCFKCNKKGHKIYDCQILFLNAATSSMQMQYFF
jgi:hypothetical protein